MNVVKSAKQFYSYADLFVAKSECGLGGIKDFLFDYGEEVGAFFRVAECFALIAGKFDAVVPFS